MENKVTVLRHCDTDFIDMLIKQNKAECLEYCYGNLLDNALYACKRGYMAVTESFLNTWNSDYTVTFSRDYHAVADDFYAIYDSTLKEYYNE